MVDADERIEMALHWLGQWADWMRRDGHLLHKMGWPTQTVLGTMGRSNHAVADDDQHGIDLIRHAELMRRMDACIETLGEQEIALKWALFQSHGLGYGGAKFGEDLLRRLYHEAIEALVPIMVKRGFV